MHGHKLYREVWDDQPPLHTHLIAWALRHVSGAVWVPRAVTVVFSGVLVAGLGFMVTRLGGVGQPVQAAGPGGFPAASSQRDRETGKSPEPAGKNACPTASARGVPAGVGLLAALLLVVSPGFLELGVSCMLEVPALATVTAALAVPVWGLAAGAPGRAPSASGKSSLLLALAAGAIFGAALQIKLSAALLLPVAGFALWLSARRVAPAGVVAADVSSRLTIPKSQRRARECPPYRSWSKRSPAVAVLCFGAGLALSFGAIQCWLGDGAYFRQLWQSHLARAQSLEYGSAAEHPFDWSLLLKDWDLTVPALVGLAISLRRARREAAALTPVLWLAVALGVYTTRRPWWSYYYVQLAAPLCWLAAIGLQTAWRWPAWRRGFGRAAAFWAILVCVGGWAGVRAYLEIAGMRQLPRLHSSLVIAEIKRFKPHVKWVFPGEPVYSFHAGIPMPPSLAVLSLKRFWSGDMTNVRLEAELRAAEPGVILLANDARERPFEDLLRESYKLVYHDQRHRLYASQAAVKAAGWATPSGRGPQWVLPKAVPARPSAKGQAQ